MLSSLVPAARTVPSGDQGHRADAPALPHQLALLLERGAAAEPDRVADADRQRPAIGREQHRAKDRAGDRARLGDLRAVLNCDRARAKLRRGGGRSGSAAGAAAELAGAAVGGGAGLLELITQLSGAPGSSTSAATTQTLSASSGSTITSATRHPVGRPRRGAAAGTDAW